MNEEDDDALGTSEDVETLLQEYTILSYGGEWK